MAAKHILMGFCALYALARGIGTVLYYLSGAGQLQIAVLIISFIVSVIGLVAVVLWIAQRQVKGITVRFCTAGLLSPISSSPGAIRCRRASAPGSFSSPVRYLSACCFWLRCSSPCRTTPTRENNFFYKGDCLIHRLDV